MRKSPRPATVRKSQPKPSPQDFKRLEQREITVEDFQDYEVCPVQRNTERHAKRAHHLHKWVDTHREVAAAIYDGRTYKIDGHTRAYIWDGKLEGVNVKPEGNLFCTFYECETEEELRQLYYTYNSHVAVKKASDMMAGAARSVGLNFETPWMQNGGYRGALAFIHSLIIPENDKRLRPNILQKGSKGLRDEEHMRQCIIDFAPELMTFDNLRPTARRFLTGIAAGSLLYLMVKPGRETEEFIGMYGAGHGSQIGEMRDAPIALRDQVFDWRQRNMIGRQYYVLQLCYTAAAINGYHKGLEYGPRGFKRYRNEDVELDLQRARQELEKRRRAAVR